jgi:hypothetical protein
MRATGSSACTATPGARDGLSCALLIALSCLVLRRWRRPL